MFVKPNRLSIGWLLVMGYDSLTSSILMAVLCGLWSVCFISYQAFLGADSLGSRVRRSGSGAGPQGRLKGGSGYKCGRWFFPRKK
jgi:hypothetical protein